MSNKNKMTLFTRMTEFNLQLLIENRNIHVDNRGLKSTIDSLNAQLARLKQEQLNWIDRNQKMSNKLRDAEKVAREAKRFANNAQMEIDRLNRDRRND